MFRMTVSLLIVFIASFCVWETASKQKWKQGVPPLGGYEYLQQQEVDQQKVQSMLSQCEDMMHQMQEENKELQERVDAVEAQIAQLKSDLSTQTTRQTSAFSAHDLTVDSTNFITKNEGDRLIFHTITVNEGGHYNAQTGQYTCPHTGLYFFSVMLQSTERSQSKGTMGPCAAIRNAHGLLARVWFYNTNVGDISVVLSGSTVVHCVAGEAVWVDVRYDDIQFYTSDNSNVFSGFLIAAEK